MSEGSGAILLFSNIKPTFRIEGGVKTLTIDSSTLLSMP